MSNALQSIGRQQFLGGDTAWDTDSFKAVLVTSGYTYNAAHDYLDDVLAGNRVATSGVLTSKTITDGYADAADVTFTAVASGSTVTGFWVFKDTGTESTSTLIAWYDTKADSSAISIATNGGDIIITWNAQGLFRL